LDKRSPPFSFLPPPGCCFFSVFLLSPRFSSPSKEKNRRRPPPLFLGYHFNKEIGGVQKRMPFFFFLQKSMISLPLFADKETKKNPFSHHQQAFLPF